MKEYKLNKEKIVFNADFKPAIDFLLKQYDIIKELNREFPIWDPHGLSFTIYDKENNCSAKFFDKKIIYFADKANDKIALLTKRILEGIRIYHKYIPVTEFVRLGVRIFGFVPIDEIKKEELADIIKSKLLLHNEVIGEVFPEKINDLAYIIDYSKDDFLYHFKCGPMPREHIPTWIDFGDATNRHFKSVKDYGDYLESLPQMSIFFDIDCYKTGVSQSGLETFLNKALDNSSQTLAKIKKYIVGET